MKNPKRRKVKVIDEQLEEDEKQVQSLEQSSPEELAVDPNIEQPSQDPDIILESDEGAEG